MIDRSEANRLLGRAIAYEHQGDLDKARAAATELVTLLADVGVLPRRMPNPNAPLAGRVARRRPADVGPEPTPNLDEAEWAQRAHRRWAERSPVVAAEPESDPAPQVTRPRRTFVERQARLAAQTYPVRR